jgi:hypothetical protein
MLTEVLANVDFQAPAELYPGPDRANRVGYRRFNTLAAAVAFSVERLTGTQRAGAAIETDGDRYDARQIASLYDRRDFPIRHRGPN